MPNWLYNFQRNSHIDIIKGDSNKFPLHFVMATTIALVIQKRRHDPMKKKTDTNQNKAKRLRATVFAIANLEDRYLCWLKMNIL